MTRDLEWLRRTLDAVDRVFFLGDVARAGVRIRWMRWRKLKTEFVYGRFDQDRKVIEINPVLMHPWVPEEVAIDVVHHECIHVVAGPDHSHVFQAVELTFPFRRRADAWCDEHINNLINAEPPAKEKPSCS